VKASLSPLDASMRAIAASKRAMSCPVAFSTARWTIFARFQAAPRSARAGSSARDALAVTGAAKIHEGARAEAPRHEPFRFEAIQAVRMVARDAPKAEAN